MRINARRRSSCIATFRHRVHRRAQFPLVMAVTAAVSRRLAFHSASVAASAHVYRLHYPAVRNGRAVRQHPGLPPLYVTVTQAVLPEEQRRDAALFARCFPSALCLVGVVSPLRNATLFRLLCRPHRTSSCLASRHDAVCDGRKSPKPAGLVNIFRRYRLAVRCCLSHGARLPSRATGFLPHRLPMPPILFLTAALPACRRHLPPGKREPGASVTIN